MATYIDERGPYMLEQIANADARRRNQKDEEALAENLLVAPNGKFAYAYSSLSVWKYRILFLPHYGPGEPRPQP